MKQSKMSREEYEAESLRLSALIKERSKAGLQGVKEMSKHPLSLEQMREQVRRQHAAPNWQPSNDGKKHS